MLATRPRFVLIAETQPAKIDNGIEESAEAKPNNTDNQLQWQFALHGLDSSVSIVANDTEHGASAQRLELLAVVRGLEALDQPSEVTLVSNCPSIRRAIVRDIETWRNNHWRWERFGKLTQVLNADLWQRIDRALAYHDIRFRGASARMAENAYDQSVVNSRSSFASHQPKAKQAPTVRFLDGRADAPAMIVVPGKRSRRTIRLSSRSDEQSDTSENLSQEDSPADCTEELLAHSIAG